MSEHLIFYDHECPLCQKAVKHIINIDRNKQFKFAPLKGKTATEILQGPLQRYGEMDSMVLMENYASTKRKISARSKASLRIYWLIGEKWRLIGALSYLPGWTADFLYSKLAQHRHQFKIQPMKSSGPSDRFLP